VDQTYTPFFRIYPAETGHIRSKAGHVRWTVSAAIFDDCFDRNLLTVSLIDRIFSAGFIILLGSSFYCWKVLSSLFSTVVARGFDFRTLADS
jgi:hypothetical protein